MGREDSHSRSKSRSRSRKRSESRKKEHSPSRSPRKSRSRKERERSRSDSDKRQREKRKSRREKDEKEEDRSGSDRRKKENKKKSGREKDNEKDEDRSGSERRKKEKKKKSGREKDNRDVITRQPGASPLPPGHAHFGGSSAPPGLEYLATLDAVMITQKVELMEVVFKFEVANKYQLQSTDGHTVFYAAETTDGCCMACLGPTRGFTLRLVDHMNTEVIRVSRPYKCCGGCCCGLLAGCVCWQHELVVESPPGNVIGRVRQHQSCCTSSFYVFDDKANAVFDIGGPNALAMMCCPSKTFPVKLLNGEKVASIKKVWGGLYREVMTDADIFKVEFPSDLDVRMKAVLIGTTFLIDFMEFESKKAGSTSNKKGQR